MKKFFTKIYYLAAVILLFVVASLPASGQTYIAGKLATNAWATAVCNDASGNVYAVEAVTKNGTNDAGKVVMYPKGAGTGTTIYTGTYSTLPFDDCEDQTVPEGIAVTSNGDVYVTINYDFSGGCAGGVTYGGIIKLTAASGYAESTFLAGTSTFGAFTGLAVDRSDNLYALVYDATGNGGANTLSGLPGCYEVEVFPSLAGKGTAPVAGSRFRINAGDACKLYYAALNGTDGYSNEIPITVDNSGNVFVADAYDINKTSNTGIVYELANTGGGANGYTKSTWIPSLNVMGLGSDALVSNQGDIFSANSVFGPSACTLIKYANGSTSSQLTLASNLSYGTEFYINSIAAVNNTDVFIDGAPSGSEEGDVEQFVTAPSSQASSISFSNTTETGTTISWTNGSGTNRAVFVATSSAGGISLTNATAYTASTIFGSGSVAGAGWFCVYNGSGSTNAVGVTNLAANAGYKVMVVEYNGSTSDQDYDNGTATNNPNTFTTPANPSLTASGGTDNYNIGGTAATVDAGITATAGQTNLNTATIKVSTNFSSGDALNFTNQNGISGTYTAATGTLTLSGSASVANYQTALRSITFTSSSGSTSQRTISFLVGDGTANSSTVTKNITITSSTTISSLTAVSSTTTNAASVQYTATFAASISGLSTADFSLNTTGVSGASVAGVSGSGTSWTVTVNTGSGDGSVQLVMNSASGVSPTVSNVPFNGATYTIDKTAPTAVSIIATSPSNATTTNASSITCTVTFSEPVTGVDASDFALTTSGTSGTVSGVSGSGTTYAVTVSSITGTGTLRLDLKGSGTGITDAAGNAISGGFTSGSVYSIDRTAPTVSSIALAESSPTKATSVDYTVTFSKPVTGVTSGAFSLLTTSGNATGAINSVSSTSTSVYTVNVISVSGTGGLRLDLSNISGISDLVGNPLASTFAGSVYAIDNTPATLTSGSYFSNNGSSSQYAKVGDVLTLSVGYNEQLQSAAMTIGGNTVPVSFSNNNQNFTGTYTMTSGDTEGNVGWTLSATDLAGNVRNYTNNDFGTVLIFDKTPPAIFISSPSQATANAAAAVNYTVTYSDANFNYSTLGAGNVTLNTTGTATGTVAVSGSGTSYTVTLSNTGGDGTLGFTIGAGTATDIPGNLALASSASGTFTVDNTPPTVSSITAATPSNATPTNATSLTYTVSFSEPVTGVSNLGFMATTTNTVASTGIAVTPVSSSVYTVTVNGISGDGTLRLDLNNANTGIFDLVGNPISGGFTTGDVYTIDNTPPTVTISAPSVATIAPGGAGTVTYTLTYADANFGSSNLTNAAVALNTSGTAHGTVTVSGSGASYTVTLSNITGEGTLGISVAGGNAVDQAGNTDAGAGPSIPVNVVSTDATLANLTLNVGKVSPAFSPGTLSYTRSVSFGVQAVAVIPTANDPNATILVNGTDAVTSGTPSDPVSLNVGSNVINVMVTAGDGSTTQSYTITVTRGGSSNANLSALVLNPGIKNPAFTSETTSYTANVANAVTATTVTPTTGDQNATVTVDGTPVASETPSGPIMLNLGPNTINVTVTAQDGSTTKTYTVIVTRAKSTNANLSMLQLNPGLKNPVFTSSNTSYTASVGTGVNSTIVTPTTSDPTATVKVNGITVVSGSPSTVPLAAGANTISTEVTAQDGVTKKTYTVIVTRPLGSNDLLSLLKLSAGTKSPVFTSSNTSYTASVGNGVSSITVTPTAVDPNATILVQGTNAIASGATSAPIALTAGSATAITIQVTAQNGINNLTYTVMVTRAPGGTDSYDPGISVTKPTETPTLADDGIQVHQGLSPNGDGVNDFLQIDNISQYPNNKLSIMNRNGQLIYETQGYDNSSKTFDGHSSKNGQMQLPGTYFYQLDYTISGITRHKTGFIVLKY